MAKVSARIDGGGRADLLSLVWVGVASVAMVYAMLLVEQQAVHHALHVSAPLEARPGSEIAITGYVFDSATESGEY